MRYGDLKGERRCRFLLVELFVEITRLSVVCTGGGGVKVLCSLKVWFITLSFSLNLPCKSFHC